MSRIFFWGFIKVLGPGPCLHQGAISKYPHQAHWPGSPFSKQGVIQKLTAETSPSRPFCAGPLRTYSKTNPDVNAQASGSLDCVSDPDGHKSPCMTHDHHEQQLRTVVQRATRSQDVARRHSNSPYPWSISGASVNVSSCSHSRLAVRWRLSRSTLKTVAVPGVQKSKHVYARQLIIINLLAKLILCSPGVVVSP